MICNPCRGETVGPTGVITRYHDSCINFWTYKGREGKLIKRPEPIRSCACQHKESWNFSVRVNDGNSTKS